MSALRVVYPWSAVVGQPRLKLALLLCAVDPAIGGVLIQGPRGVAKTTLARALSELIVGAFVELPLGATEERVTGSLDLEAALRDQRVVFSPGLLARAHEGVLYVDEVNLLPDALVDSLLDAAATGQNVVERDGVSHTHAARFVLVGTMNPEEGELRPQLLDRFGLCVHAEPEIAPSERMQIVQRRLAFDRDGQAFALSFAEEQRWLRQRCATARACVADIALDASVLELISQRCYAARVEGVRADLALLRAARAHAALHGRAAVSAEDVEAVAEFALAHRRGAKGEPPPPRSGGGSKPGPGTSSQTPTRASGSTPAADGGQNSRPDGAATKHSALPPVPVRALPPPRLPATIAGLRSRRANLQHRGRAQLTASTGRRGRATDARDGAAIDWFRTLTHNARPTSEQLRYRTRRAPAAQLWVLLVDCSASMLRSGALAEAKGIARAFEMRAARSGAHVAVIGFRDQTAHTAVSSRAGRSVLEQGIAALSGGGGTPLRAAFLEAQRLCLSPRFRSSAVGKRWVLITDGRTTESVADLVVRRSERELLVIDCERGPVRLGRTRQLAAALGGRYHTAAALSGG
ncbi:MAG: magnesium chelatase ATPase subunit [Pseudomonadota bacterium]